VETKILEKINGYSEYAIELQRGLVAIPALCPSNGGEGELDKTVWLESELRKLPFDSIQRFDAPDPRAKGGIRPNVVARYKGTSSTKTLWLMGHLDVVPPGEPSLWKTDPYKMVIDGDKLYGRGTEDNHQGVVSSLLCVKAMMDCGYRPPVDVALLFAADEETGSAYGAGYIVDHHPEIFGKDDMFIVPDGGNPEGTLVEIAEKSIFWLRIRTHGQQCHASVPAMGKNAFRAASDFVVKLGSLRKKYNARNKLFDPPMSTFEPTKKEPNVPNVNTIPGEDVFYLDSRVLPEYKLADVKAEIQRLAHDVEKRHGVTISFEPVQEGEAAPPTSPDAPLVTEIIRAAKQIYKVKGKPKGIGGGTVAAFFRRLHLPAVVYSKINEVAHQPNEYCEMKNLIGDAKVFSLVAMRMQS